MRRKDREIEDKSIINSILDKAQIIRIALCYENMPYVVPMSFGYEDDTIFLHCAKEGKKLDIIRKNNNICFEVEGDIELKDSDVPCNWGVKYQSVIGYGKAFFAEDIENKRLALNVIMKKYSGSSNHSFPDTVVENTQIIKINIDRIKGKSCGY